MILVPGHALARPDDDGYVRMTFDAFLTVPLFHLMSGLDEDKATGLPDSVCSNHVGGYTEWLSHAHPVITLGWDWQILVTRQSPLCVRINSPRSNLMFVDLARTDVGPIGTLRLLEHFIDHRPWHEQIMSHVNLSAAS
ncbi:MAG: DUF4902 domain-containing protein [Moraxellaceae bacterium]|nr:DUF4902 domain-containing protein [Moraxellaceae bacterium]